MHCTLIRTFTLAVLALLPLAAWPQTFGWECRSTDAAGNCYGLSTYTFDNGTRISGLRGTLGGQPAWSGLIIRHYPNGDRRECLADPSGSCAGTTTHYRADGIRETGIMQTRNGQSEWTGTQQTYFPNGDRLECVVTAEGRCNGGASLSRASGNRISGRLIVQGSQSLWVGRAITTYVNGDRKDCEVSGDGLCQGSTIYTYADGTRMIGTRMPQGDHDVWTGTVTQIFPSGRQMSCSAAATDLCRDDTQIPIDRTGHPLVDVRKLSRLPVR